MTASHFKLPLYAALIITAILSIISPFLWTFPFELLSNFRVYYLIFAACIAIALLILHLRKHVSQLPIYLALALTAFNSVWIFPWYLPNSHQTDSADTLRVLPNSHQTDSADTLRVLTFNINIRNQEWDNIAAAIRNVDPDIATIIETTETAKDELASRLSDRYPNTYHTPGRDLTLLSKLPIRTAQSKSFNGGDVLTASIQTTQGPIDLLAAHPHVPIRASTFHQRNALLADIAADTATPSSNPKIILGDFNLTPWSPYYTRFITKTNLHNVSQGFGIHPTWFESSPYSKHPRILAAYLHLPIDHIFATQDILVSSLQTREAANADHRMLWADLTFTTPET